MRHLPSLLILGFDTQFVLFLFKKMEHVQTVYGRGKLIVAVLFFLYSLYLRGNKKKFKKHTKLHYIIFIQ